MEINTDPEYEGDAKCVGCNYESLTTSAVVGNTVYMRDGDIMGKILEVGEVSDPRLNLCRNPLKSKL